MFFTENKQYVTRFIITFSLVCLLLIASFVHIYKIEWFLPIQGFSALDFSNTVLYPNNFLKDYPGGAGSIKQSILPWVYPLLMKTGVSYHLIYYVMVFLEVMTLATGAAILLRTIAPKVNPLSYLLLIALLTLSWARTDNLANFGYPFFHGQFYGFADGLSLLGFAMLLQRRMISSFLLFVVSFMIHPLITAFMLIFVATYQIVSSQTTRAFFSNIGYLLVLGIFALSWYGFLSDKTKETISAAEFFRYSYILNRHWFPQDLKLFTVENLRYANPFFAALLFGVTTLARSALNIRKSAFLCGFFVLLIVSFIGCFVAYFELSAVLVKSCLQRASISLLTLVTILVSYQSIHDLFERRYFFFFISFFCLMSSFFMINAWPSITAVIYAVLFILKHNKQEAKDVFFKVVLVSLLVYSGYQLFLLYKGFNTFADYAAQTMMFIKWGGLFGLCLLLIKLCEKYQLSKMVLWPFYFISICLAFGVSNWSKNFLYKDMALFNKVSDYKAVQLWAERETDKTTLFMVDPSYAYGWRDFSKRSSLGTPHEWLKSAWLYNGNTQVFQEGLERTWLLIDNTDLIPEHHPKNRGTLEQELFKHALTNFYKQDGSILIKMVKKYGIDYIVFDKLNAPKYGEIPQWMAVYENPTYVVMQPPIQTP